ncbi:hypothetical protein B2M26_05385 [Ferroacidibacillus organovorans]|uniref:Uncharacterized protein n=1 Tax=Ferroacidibacillus organovorans TaxID=1765683 RepID=A0A1V4EUU5_9BACL|nr:hypothetical protein B2M26_05385 [Ferroacidibacillus organovorans]
MIERAFHLWSVLANMKYGSQVYMYVALNSVVSGPMNLAGGGTNGEPRSLRVYRNKWREMEGYPLSLPDTVCLRRHGVALTGEDIRSRMPTVPSDWVNQYLGIQLSELKQAVNQKIGPFGDRPQEAAVNWGPEGIMSYPIWFARHLYSLSLAGEVTSKERAIQWYLDNHHKDTLRISLETILKWRTNGVEPSEVEFVANLTRESTMDFLRHIARLKNVTYGEIPSDLLSTLEFLSLVCNSYGTNEGTS